MKRDVHRLWATAPFAITMFAAAAAFAQKHGGILVMSHFDSPASMSMHEEATGAVNRPMMGVFNNLVMYRQDVAQNSMGSIVPDLATGWSWNEEGTQLTLPLRPGVGWHDGKPFTARDVKCTWDLLMDTASEKLRASYRNLDWVTTNGDYELIRAGQQGGIMGHLRLRSGGAVSARTAAHERYVLR